MTISDGMVEAGARAICAAVGDDPDQKTYAREMVCSSNDREPKQRWEFWVGHSRAALEAALTDHVVVPREPTQAMISAPELPYSPAEMREFWQIMIAAAPPTPAKEVG